MTGNREPVAVARIRDADGNIAGTGFLVAPNLLLTCFHVLPEAETPPGPAGTVAVDFPRRPKDWATRAQIVATVAEDGPGRGDTALLRLLEPPPPDLVAARLHLVETTWGEEVRIFGYAGRRPEGIGDAVGGKMRHERSSGLLQIQTDASDPRIAGGFSGSPVYSPESDAVVGMVVSRYTGETTCNAIPVNTLFEHFPQLSARDPAEVSPYRGLEPFEERHAEWFRGREELTAELARQLLDRRLLIVLGPSGSGKSSLVQAGLIPLLRRMGRLGPDRPAAGRPSVGRARLRPGEDAWSLVARLVTAVLGPEANEPAARLATESEHTLRELAGQLDEHAGDTGVLLFVDQLEEAEPEVARQVIALLDHLVRVAGPKPRADGTARLMAVVTLRAGALEGMLTAESAAAVRAAATPMVPPMGVADLHAAITAGGVAFEPGLVDRILADAGTEPGRLPLVEFTLDLLWQGCRANTVTIEAYHRLGGVSGALATYADEVLDRLATPDRDRVRGVLTAMARPAEDGTGFRRRPLELSGLDAPTRAVVEELAARRLVVIHSEYAEPAHQALLESWPTLRGWLDEDRDFLAWHDQLRTDRRRWADAEQDPGALLRGAALAAADRWTAERPAQIGAADLAFIKVSGGRERRRLRLLRTTVAVVSILAILAALLAVLAVRRSAEVAAQLRVTASRQLAAHATQYQSTDPARSLQFAEAAWKTSGTAEAYGALLTQYAMLASVDRIFEQLWTGTAETIQSSDDGRVALITTDDGPVGWIGLSGDHPQRFDLPGARRDDTFRVDPTGRYVAGAGADGAVTVWTVADPGHPRTLAASPGADLPVPLAVGNLAFSADGARLLVFRTPNTVAAGVADRARHEPDLRVWQVADGARVPSAVPLFADSSFRVFFTPVAGTVVVTGSRGAQVHDLSTGRVRRRAAGADLTPALNGAVLLDCDGETLHVRDTVSGAARRTIRLASCNSAETDANQGSVILTASTGERAAGVTVSITDLRTGRLYRDQVPPADDADLFDEAVSRVVAPGPDGTPVMLSARQTTLYRNRLTPAVEQRMSVEDQFGRALAADGTTQVIVRDSGRIEVTDAATGRSLATATGRPPGSGFGTWGAGFVITADSRTLLIAEPDAVAAYTLPSLDLRWRSPLPEPDFGALSPAAVDDLYTTVTLTGPDRLAVLHRGLLSWWDTGTGRQVADPLPLSTGSLQERLNAGMDMLGPVRPGHPDQVVVVHPGGAVLFWSLTERRMLFGLDAGAFRNGDAVAFDRTGNRLAVAGITETAVWELDPAPPRRRPVTSGNQNAIVGFTPQGHLVLGGITGEVEVWDVDPGLSLARISAPGLGATWRLIGDQLVSRGPAGSRVIPLDPDQWFQRLCRLSARPFTGEEQDLIRRENAPADPPCA
ncbi:hypothetical protein GCM10010168_25530 [Actinoplanes ianthinogenes]|uniref:Novel STAND NTPase 1 domain-containing protein n=1 Tax=Actinoplanes ianthinogenes TaxID=122358 RepID=A0ABM7M945_9ACTN|nr:trypsin-like peptidase domain-containing protein [Actinoplanes ianthinogenes]BCJ48193.1 hypothetical protein Aiant_88500 [Actinoplanes ianthinogenes]GGR07070.1 hypothetical protein GCM10010168_25530 [Actinoplanes ianthinogenes]